MDPYITIFGYVSAGLSPELAVEAAEWDGPFARLYRVNWSLCPAEPWGCWAAPVIKACQSLYHFEPADVLLFHVAFKHLPAQHPTSD